MSEQDRVREALVRVLREANDASFRHVKALGDALGVVDGAGLADLADALLSRPAPRADGGVTEAMVEAAWDEYWSNADVSENSRDTMRRALVAALAAREGR